MDDRDVDVELGSIRPLADRLSREGVSQEGDPAGEVRAALRRVFLEESEANAGLFDEESRPVRAEIAVVDDLDGSRPEETVTLEASAGDPRAGRFRVSSHLVVDEILQSKERSSHRAVQRSKADWAGAFLRMADRGHIAARNEQLQKARRGSLLASLGIGGRTEIQLEDLPREWQLLWILARFRDEGLVGLYEHLVGGQRLPVSGKDAITRFRDSMDVVMRHVRRDFHDWKRRASATAGDCRREVEALGELSQVVGPYFCIDAIHNRIPASRNRAASAAARKAVKAMKAGREPGLTREEAVGVVRVGLGLDVASFVESLAEEFGDHPWGKFIDMAEMSELYNFLSYEGREPSSKFLESLFVTIMHCDMPQFRETLENAVVCMDDDELRRRCAAWRPGPEAGDPSQSAILAEIVSRKSALCEFVSAPDGTDEDELRCARLALTYLFEEEDYIDDSIPLMGYMDDLYVLRAACVLIGLRVEVV